MSVSTKATLAGAVVWLASGGVWAKAPVVLSALDYAQIQQLYATYVTALDLGQGERLADTFVADGEFIGSSGGATRQAPIRGAVALKAMGDSRSGARHFTTNLVVTPLPDGEVEGTCYLMLIDASTKPVTVKETAIYDDRLVKTNQGWKFKRRVVWRDDDPQTPFKTRSITLPK